MRALSSLTALALLFCAVPAFAQRTTACACVRGGNPAAVQSCLRGRGQCGKFKEIRNFACRASQKECVPAFAGGKCPFDLDKRYRIVSVDNSPQCDGSAGAKLNAVALAWNDKGGWITRSAPTLAEAQARSLQSCNSAYRDCKLSNISLGELQRSCMAVAWHPGAKKLFAQKSATRERAVSQAKQSCAKKYGGPLDQCTIQYNNCNFR